MYLFDICILYLQSRVNVVNGTCQAFIWVARRVASLQNRNRDEPSFIRRLKLTKIQMNSRVFQYRVDVRRFCINRFAFPLYEYERGD